MEIVFILTSFLLVSILSLFKGKIEGYLYYYWLKYWLGKKDSLEKMNKEGKLLHKITIIPLLATLIFILLIACFKINPLAVLFLGISLSTISPLFHLGAYFYTRNKLNKDTYKQTYKSTDLISDGNTEKNKKLTNKLFDTYKKRVIFAIISIISLTLTILLK